MHKRVEIYFNFGLNCSMDVAAKSNERKQRWKKSNNDENITRIGIENFQ